MMPGVHTGMAVAAVTLGLAGAPVMAQQTVLDDPTFAGTLVGQVCVTDAMTFQSIFDTAIAATGGTDLPVVVQNDKTAMFGNPAGTRLVFSRTIDSIACSLTIPAPTGSQAYFDQLRSGIAQRIGAVYPDALSVDANPASPHEEKHDWVFSVPAERHFAATLEWQVEGGVSLGIGYRQVYE